MRSPCALTCTPAGGMPTSRSATHSLATRSGGQACGRRKHSCAACEVEEPAAPIGQTSAAQGVAKACTGRVPRYPTSSCSASTARGYNETTRARFGRPSARIGSTSRCSSSSGGGHPSLLPLSTRRGDASGGDAGGGGAGCWKHTSGDVMCIPQRPLGTGTEHFPASARVISSHTGTFPRTKH